MNLTTAIQLARMGKTVFDPDGNAAFWNPKTLHLQYVKGCRVNLNAVAKIGWRST